MALSVAPVAFSAPGPHGETPRWMGLSPQPRRVDRGNYRELRSVGSGDYLTEGATEEEDEELLAIKAPHLRDGYYYFTEIGNLRRLGKYTLTLNAVLNENDATVYGGRELPRCKYEFTIKEGNAEKFTVELSSSQQVGVPFNISLHMKDCYGHPTKSPPNPQPDLQCSGLELSYGSTASSGDLLTIRDVKVTGKLPKDKKFKNYDLKVTLPGLKNDTQTTKFTLSPGHPHSLHVTSKTIPLEVENGNSASFKVEVHDEAGNITRIPKHKVHCQISGMPSVNKDCSTGEIELETKPVNQKIVNGQPKMLEAKFEIPSLKQVAPVTAKVKVMPSRRISRMKLFRHGEQEELVLKNKEKWKAGGIINNLFYKLYDEAEREVPIIADIASKIEVSWGRDVNNSDLEKGKLPDLQVATHVSEEHLYQVSYQDKNVSTCFTIVPYPNEPAQLKVTPSQSTVKLGENLSGHIQLELVDKYGNVTKELTADSEKDFAVEAEGLDKSSLNFKRNESNSCILVKGVRFHSGSPGSRVIWFGYKDYKESVVLKVTAGVPSQLRLVSGPEQALQVLNGHGIPTPFLVELCDEWGNPSPDQNLNVEIKASPVTVELTTSVTSPPVDSEGKACIKVNNVKGSKGCYALAFKGSLYGKSIPGPSVNLTLLPDPNKPVSLSVNYDKSVRIAAGGKFPVFSVTVLSEEEVPMTAFKPEDLSMLLWEGASSERPETAPELRCRKPIEDQRKDCYQFREEEIPTRAGEYTIEFTLQTDKPEDHLSTQISVNVVANEPIKLEPDCQPQTPVVFYCTDIADRILVENMTLKITDKFGNSAGQDLSGTVSVSIKFPVGERNGSLPLFEGPIDIFTVVLKEGSAHIDSLAIMENSPGENGSRYILLFQPEVPFISLSPFELPFHFYNDTENQKKRVELMRKKDKINDAIKEYDTRFNRLRQQMDSHKDKVKETTDREVSLRNELNRKGIGTDRPLSITDIEGCLKMKKSEMEKIERTHRAFSIPYKCSGPDVLGMVGQLALVDDDAVARVISWHLQGDMDCVITTTTAAAQKIYKDTGGNQQLMALDSILVQQANRTLPHKRNGRTLFTPAGNPVFATDLLNYPQSCDLDKRQKVFRNLLGPTILMDDLFSATDYRKALVEEGIQCPTILTRDGERVSAKGKFGGANNRAPLIDKLKVFGAPLPQHYHELNKEMDMLCQYRAAVKEKEKAEKDHNDFCARWLSEILQAEAKKDEKNKEEQEIESQLASISVRPGKRASGSSEESPSIATKRQRQKSMEEALLF